ncbi:ABC transporter ATP-binding protein [Propionibacterium sp. oral taxon 192]|uniref:ABC transporter ATP-binding protein n=1 Tax=Propionibacterium sp. oral taxon 192 TaxID=671222 RepID=UPI0018DC8E12|nr:ABC transporter ATP-binding protein [Propionibacterium sp. oral taxon 192]
MSDAFTLRDISLAVESGQALAVVGTNGAGKTTLIRLVAGLLAPSEGQIRICGESPRNWGRVSQHLGYVQQSKELPDGVSVRTYLQHQLRLRRAALKRYTELVHRAGLVQFEDQEVRTLSGGNQRKLHIICAVAHQPDLLVLDEPTAGLDPTAQETVLGLLGELKKEGVAIVFASHHKSELEALADSVTVLHQGRQILGTSLTHLLAGDAPASLILEANTHEEIGALQRWAANLPSLKTSVRRVCATDDGVLVELINPHDRYALTDLVSAASLDGLTLRLAKLSTPSLADVIAQLVQRDGSE